MAETRHCDPTAPPVGGATARARGPLAGLTVLDLSWGVAGPITAMLLADSGADVLRVEPPGGDPVRDDVAYKVWNRGKRSAVLDLTDAEQRAAFLRLADAADVLVESFAPGVTIRLGIDAPTLRARNPRLVYCSITGYGPDGPDAHRPGYDSLVAARTGLQWESRGVLGTPLNRIRGAAIPNADVEIPDLPANRFDQEGPVFLRSTWPSLGAAYNAVVGVSAALRAREVTGRGDLVETSLARGAIAANAPNWQWAENLDAPGFWMWVTDRRSPEGLFECADGRWVHFWTIRPSLVLEAAEGDELVLDGPKEDMKSGIRIGMDADEVPILYLYYGLLQEAFKKFPSEQWVAFGAARNLGIALVRSPEEAFADPALLAQGCVVEVDDPDAGPIRHAGVVLEFSETPGAVQGPAPRRGGAHRGGPGRRARPGARRRPGACSHPGTRAPGAGPRAAARPARRRAGPRPRPRRRGSLGGEGPRRPWGRRHQGARAARRLLDPHAHGPGHQLGQALDRARPQGPGRPRGAGAASRHRGRGRAQHARRRRRAARNRLRRTSRQVPATGLLPHPRLRGRPALSPARHRPDRQRAGRHRVRGRRLPARRPADVEPGEHG
ncbi:CoA transferase [Frankia sp. CNm7]|uniref:CoA transferase n=1 Tax=Frankia nepalensis TaxID=1836974 RepID=A0A937RBM1_9ACTN|nr:CoA transferase [Frankia nepalensis]MBL7512118.1 CoA transferase [Frankia nepalensis]MBL7521033.1 CoA transferase [Frankia nepalensis]MBL7627307.1 CoA transferase [Frankia nepalensis]